MIVPDNYKCSVCGISGVKLWREYAFCLPVDLFCFKCGKENQKLPDWNFQSKYGTITDHLGSLVPAIPTDGTYWGYSSVPSEDCKWWHHLTPSVPNLYPEYFVSDEEWKARIEKEEEEERKWNDYKKHETDTSRCRVMIQASSDEQFFLWQAWSNESDWQSTKYPYPKVNWKQVNIGTSLQIGEIAGRPICVAIAFAEVEGQRIGFYYGCSQLVDHKMIEEWIVKQAPNATFTNATNFHNALRRIEELNNGN